jgi:hypothetical protein
MSPQIDQTVNEIIESLTGHEEMGITAQFGTNIGKLVADQPMLRRACVFTVKRRESMNEDDARNFALNLPLGEVSEFFAEESEESGKDEHASEQKPTPSPDGVTEPDAHEMST